MQLEQFSRDPALHDLYHIRYAELGACIHEQMDMVRHHLHCLDLKPVLLREGIQQVLTIHIRSILQDFSPVFCAPDDMILKGIDITSTIC